MSPENDIIVSVDGVSRRFHEGSTEHVVLDAADLQVRRGEALAIRGRSGSGKSTLLNLLGGIDIPDAGSIRIADTELTSLSEQDRTLFRRRRLGFIYQAFNLIPTLDVADNIRLVLELNDRPRGDADERIEELLEAVGLADRASSFPDVLSGGEQQRVAIARALSHRPEVLIADEPTGNLDDASADSVLALLDSLVRREGTTLLVATHSTRLADACDRSVSLHNGRLD